MQVFKAGNEETSKERVEICRGYVSLPTFLLTSLSLRLHHPDLKGNFCVYMRDAFDKKPDLSGVHEAGEVDG